MVTSYRSFVFFILLIPLLCPAKNYKGAELRTKEAYVYGRFEARYKAAQGNGMLASFFTYHDIQSNTGWNEIDFEILGRYSDDVQVTTITPGQIIHNSHQWVPFNTRDDFHTYAFEWTPAYVAWFIDGTEVYRQTEDHIQTLRHPQKIMMNIWNPEWAPWSGVWDDRILPLFAYYDRVSYSSYTPGSGNSGTNNNFSLIWKDEFDSWDQSRWEKGTHTWGGNGCDFVPENAVFKSGLMILCLTNSSTLGFLDKTPPSVLWARASKNTVSVHFSEEVDRASAEIKTNYLISGSSISNVKLLPDNRTAELSVAEFNPETQNNLVVLGIRDTATPAPNKLTGQSVAIAMAKPLTFPVRINVGGGALANYLPDQLWGPDVEYGHMDGYEGKWAATQEIHNTDQDSVYRSELHELVEYKLRVPNGKYKVTLMMAENNFNEAGRRIYDIQIEDKIVATDLDLIQIAGFHTAHEIVVESADVADEILDVHFTNKRSFSLLNGLIVESLNTRVGNRGEVDLPRRFHLPQNYPNPFNASTTISYDLPEQGHVNLAIYDILGKRIEQLVSSQQDPGKYDLNWNASVPSGIYFYRVDFKSKDQHISQVRKMAILN